MKKKSSESNNKIMEKINNNLSVEQINERIKLL